jgi:hypothetical protein
MSLVLLGILGATEAVVWFWSMRAAVKDSQLANAVSVAATGLCRVWFVSANVNALLVGEAMWVVCLAYVLPAVLARCAALAISKRRAERKRQREVPWLRVRETASRFEA